MKLAIVGSRNWYSPRRVREFVQALPLDTVIVSGGAVGVDSDAEQAARERGMTVEVYKPDWKKHDRAAGIIRNRQIVDAADKVVAFWDGESRGTKFTIDYARQHGKLQEVFG